MADAWHMPCVGYGLLVFPFAIEPYNPLSLNGQHWWPRGIPEVSLQSRRPRVSIPRTIPTGCGWALGGLGVPAHRPNIRRPKLKNHDKQVAKMDSAPPKIGGGGPHGAQRGQNLVWGPGGPKKGHFGQLGGGIFWAQFWAVFGFLAFGTYWRPPKG